VLGTRIFGGRPLSTRLIRIPWEDVAMIGTNSVRLRAGFTAYSPALDAAGQE
jgi:hypothetical protein